MAANPNPGTSNVYTSYSGPNKYGAPPNNSNRQPLNNDNAILTQDYTGRAQASPDATADVTSPTANLTANAIKLQIPPNATRMTMVSTAAFQFSEFGTVGAALTQSYAQPANVPITIDVARQKFIFVTGTTPLNFFFQTL